MRKNSDVPSERDTSTQAKQQKDNQDQRKPNIGVDERKPAGKKASSDPPDPLDEKRKKEQLAEAKREKQLAEAKREKERIAEQERQEKLAKEESRKTLLIENEIKQRLTTIKALERDGKPDVALKHARDLVRLHPDTEAAKEALKIIERMTKKD